MSQERAQPVRPTQFLTTYGPGAVLDSLRGPRLVLDFELSGLFQAESPADYEIREPALSQLLPESARIFRLPCNADLGQNDGTAIYETESFPKWSLCPSHGVLYRYQSQSKKSCPNCPAAKSTFGAWEQSRQQAISFVMVCEQGHLQDVSWPFLLHQGGPHQDCKSDHLLWRGVGGPLRGVSLVCPKCRSEARLADLYHRDHPCGGFFPERRMRETCKTRARISQRAAADLYLPEVLSALTLPRGDSLLYHALRHDSVANTVATFLKIGSLTEDLWEVILGNSRVPEEVRRILSAASLEERQKVAEAVTRESEPVTTDQARAEELRALCEAAATGLPRSSNFEIDPTSAGVFSLGPVRLRVTPVHRLRMVSAQLGYRRLGGPVVETLFKANANRWFPGVEQFGEGLFLQLLDPLDENGPVWRAWATRFEQGDTVGHHPRMVWWHSLSHRLIRALAVDSGYSAASVRERLYVDGDNGGLLIYAVQPGGDGTLGGLIALVPRFDRILAAALAHLDSCSNDPLCGEQQIAENRQNGAACYACSLLSETSCEMRNFSLDRNLLVETIVR